MDFKPEEITEEEMLRELIRQEIGEYYQQQALTSSGNDAFYRQQSYLNSLVEVASRTDHKLHDEIDDAVKKLKELAIAG